MVAPSGTAPIPARRGLSALLTSLTRPGLVAVLAVAVAVRAAPYALGHRLTGPLGTDDGELFSISAHLRLGLLPYRDVVTGEPPGFAVLLLPFAALATIVGDPVALAAARVAFILLGSVNALLVVLLLRRSAPQWAVPAGLLYATWRLPAAAERTLTLEPLLTFGLLGGLLLLGPDHGPDRPRRLAASGALVGLAVAVTTWAAPAALLLAGYLLVVRGPRRVAGWAAGAAATFTVLAGPLIAAAPAEFARQVVRGPIARASEVTMSERLRRFSDVVRIGGYELPTSIDVMLATCVVVGLAALAVTAWGPPARLFVLLAVLQCGLVAAAPDHVQHRFAAAPTLVLVAAIAAHTILPNPWTSRIRRPLLVTAVLGFAGLTATAVHHVAPLPPDPAGARAFAAGHRCVWFEKAADAIAADALTRQLSRGCAVPADRLAVLDELDPTGTGPVLRRAHHSSALQDRLRAELAASDAAVVPDDEAPSLLDEESRRLVDERFRVVGGHPGAEYRAPR